MSDTTGETPEITPMDQFGIAGTDELSALSVTVMMLFGSAMALLPFLAAGAAARWAGPGWWLLATPLAGLLTALLIGLAFRALVPIAPSALIVAVEAYAHLLLPF